MRRVLLVIVVVLLAACASVPVGTLTPADADYCALFDVGELVEERAANQSIICTYDVGEGGTVRVNMAFFDTPEAADDNFQQSKILMRDIAQTQRVRGPWREGVWYEQGFQFYTGNVVIATMAADVDDPREVSIEAARAVMVALEAVGE